MTSKTAKYLLCLVLILSLAACLFGCNKTKDVYAGVVSVAKDGDNRVVILEIQNNTDTKLKFGWVNNEAIEIYTSTGDYTVEMTGEIPSGSYRQTFVLEDCTGRIEKIVIQELNCLDDRGLPGSKLKNWEIYNASKEITADGKNFGFLGIRDNSAWIFILMGVILVGMAVVAIWQISANRRYAKKARAAWGQPDPTRYHVYDPNQQNQ